MIGISVMATTPKFDIYVGPGSVLTNTTGNSKEYSAHFTTSYNVGVRAFILPKLAINLNYGRDSLNLGNWQAKGKYNYTALGLSLEYWCFKDAYVFAQPTYFTSPVANTANKVGYEAGIGFKSMLSKHFYVNGQVGYMHVQDFIFNVANAGNLKFVFGYSF